jgi:hypothetical protein
MDLVTRYVDAVKQFLPKGQQDIARELSENIRSAMDDRAEALGRPLTEDEQAALLKQMGHPVLVAGRYHTSQHSFAFGPQIIGPVLFPLYVRILALAIGLMLAGSFVVTMLTGGSLDEWVGSVGLLNNAWVQFLIITAIFGAAQQYLNRHPDKWDPRDPLSPVTLPADKQWVSRFESLTQIVVLSIALAWLYSLRGLTLPAELGLIVSPLWATVYWVLLGCTAATLVQPIVNFFKPRWVMFRVVYTLVVDAVWLVVLIYLLSSGPWVTSGIADSVNPLIALSLQITILVMVVMMLWEARPLLRPLLRTWQRRQPQ